jgi:hypothetical protein
MQGSERPSQEEWRDLYLAALFEADLEKLPQRIAEAECALSRRARELWYSGCDHKTEEHALTGAMRALEALRNIHQCPRPVAVVRKDVARAGSGILWRSR